MPRITDLPELTTATDDDVLVIDDSPASGTTTKKITRGNLLKGLAKQEDLATHTTATDNPHHTTKSQVGLSNVPNTDATQRANHTGTQAIGTVEGLQPALDSKASTSHTQSASTITDFDTAVSENEDVTANTSARHAHANKALLDTYTQTNADIVDAIAKEHTHSNKVTLDATTAAFTTSDESKLDGIEAGAQVNEITAADIADFETTSELDARDTSNRSRANHTGTQLASTISNFNTTADARITAQKGQNNGLATLDGSGKVPSAQLPSYVDDVMEFATSEGFPATGEAGKIYVALDTNRVYRWGGSAYTEISSSPGSTDAVPEGSTNLYFTNERAAAASPVQSVADKTGAVALTKDDVGLGNVPNVDATQRSNHTGTQSADTITDGTTNKVFSAAEKAKLSGIATGATANSSDSSLLDRSNHTGSQPISTITDLQSSLDAKANDAATVHRTGDESIDGTKTFTSSPVVPGPSADMQAATKKYVDDSLAAVEPGDSLPAQSGNSGKFLTTDGSDPSWADLPGGGDMARATYDPTNVGANAFAMDNMVEGDDTKILTASERSAIAGAAQTTDLAAVATSGDYADLSDTPTLGTAAAAATEDFASATQGALADTAVQPADLGAVATSNSYDDLDDKPTLITQGDIDSSIASLVDSSPAALDTLNELAAALGDDPNFASTVTTQIGTKADASVVSAHISDTANPHGVTKSQVGLDDVDNTSDADKPVSLAQQAALDQKQAKTVVAVGQTDGDFAVSSYTATTSKSAFQLALEAAFASSSHVLILGSASPYTMLSTHALANGQTLEGVDRDSVVLQMASGRNVSVLTNANASSGGMTTDVTIRNLTIDQQGDLQTAGGGIVVTGIQGWQIENVKIKKSYRFNFLCLHHSSGVANLSGTVSLTAGTEVVAGSGTAFTTELAVGDVIKTAGGKFGRVASISSDTELILTRAWGYTTESAVTYKKILPNSFNNFRGVEFCGTVHDADASGYGFFDYSTLTDCLAHHANGGGCGFVPDHTRGLRIINCRSHSNDNSGFSFETCEEIVTIGGASWGNINGNGYQLISGSTRCQVIGMDAYGNGGHGFTSSYNISTAPVPDENAFIDCLAHHNAGYGVRFDGCQRNIAQNCRVWNNNTGGMVTNTANSRLPSLNRFKNCVVYDDRTTKLQQRGIYILTGDQNTVEFCTSRDEDHVISGFFNSGTNTTLITLANSSIGINTNNPTAKFQVNTPTTADANAQFMSAATAATHKPFVVQAHASQSANLLELQSSAGNVFASFTAGGLLRGPNANANAPTFSFANDGDTGFYRPAGSADTVRIATAATDRLQVNTTEISASLPVAMGNNAVTGLPTPSNDGDAARKKYVDDGLATKAGTIHTHAQSDITNLTTDLANKVPTTRTINGSALSSNVTLTQDDIGDGSTFKQFSATDQTKLAGVATGADVTSSTNVGSVLQGVSGKTTPVDADTLPLNDSAASNALKKLTWSNLKATLKSYFDTLYEAAGSIATHAGLTATHGATGAVVGTTNTQTLTNKRLTPRAPGTTSAGTITPTSDASDMYRVTALATNATIGAPTGTPTDGQKLLLRIKDDGTARTLSWNAIYRPIGVTLPSTTTAGKTLYVGLIFNSADTKWDVLAVGVQD